jgi:alpha-amylase
MNNETIMQYFEWYLPNDCSLWKKVSAEAQNLKETGITALWLPPAYKASDGKDGVGYSVYDLYDLGEFNQKGSIPTKYGTKDEYLEAIDKLHKSGIKAIADIVLNHKFGADDLEQVIAVEDNPQNRNDAISSPKLISAWTKYTFPGRGDTYSSFKWDWTHFHGVDWDETRKQSAIYKFYGKHWDNEVDNENGNYDYLMGADIDLNNLDVVNELTNWGKWYVDFANLDGFRLDAVKHIRADFYKTWLSEIRKYKNKDLFAVGEYWSRDINKLNHYLETVDNSMCLFDVPLHYNFLDASNSNGFYDMRTILNGSLLQANPDKAITFVDNHDTQPGQSLQSWIPDWFKPLAYSIILLRNKGTPCVFYGDYYGIPHDFIDSKANFLKLAIYVRKKFAYGNLKDYFDDFNIVGWTLDGDEEHKNSGLAVLLTDGPGGSKLMNIGQKFAGSTFYDCTGHVKEKIIIDENGNAEFKVNGGSVSIWILSPNG